MQKTREDGHETTATNRTRKSKDDTQISEAESYSEDRQHNDDCGESQFPILYKIKGANRNVLWSLTPMRLSTLCRMA